MARTLTTANSAFALQIEGLYPVPQNIQGYAADDSFAADDVAPVETSMGVDGKLSGGYTPYPTDFNVTLQADSASNDIFDNWLAAQKAANEALTANAIVRIQGTGKVYALTKGFLTMASPMPGSKKILQPRKFKITFESCSPSPV